MWTNSKGVSYYKRDKKYYKNTGWLEQEITENEYNKEKEEEEDKIEVNKRTREQELLERCFDYFVELTNDYIDILVNSVGMSKDELIEYGFDYDDIEEYFNKN